MSRIFRRTLSLFAAAALAVSSALFLPTGVAQAAPLPVSSAGREFWLAFDANQADPTATGSSLTLYVSGAPGTTGQVGIAGLDMSGAPITGTGVPFTKTFVVPAAGVTEVDIPLAARLTKQSDPVDLAIHVTADADVTVYGVNHTDGSTDAYLGLPVSVIGTRYRAIEYGGTFASFVSMVPSVAGATTVHVEPPAGKGPAFDKVIQQGEVFEWTADFDITGTLVTSDQPISVFSGNECAYIPAGYGFCDHIVEQMVPTSAWGKTFVTVPLATRKNGDTFRILADFDNTTVTIAKAGGDVVETLDAGEYYELISDGAMAITATKPVLVAQYSNGIFFDNVDSDPFMTLIPPYEQGFTSSTFAVTTTGFSANFVNITAPTTSVSGVTLNGSVIPAALWAAIPGSDYSGVAVPVVPGFYTVESSVPVLATVYGFERFDSYGYPAGLRIAPIADAAALALYPDLVTGSVGDSLCVTVALFDKNSVGIEGARIDVTLDGVVSTSTSVVTEADGTVEFCAVSAAEGTSNFKATQGALSGTGEFIWMTSPIQTTRTITYTGAGVLTPANVVQTVMWDVTWVVTKVGGVTTYTPVGSYGEVPSPVVDGYTFDRSEVPTEVLMETTSKPGNSTVTVTYTKSLDIQTGGSVLTPGEAMSGPTAIVALFCFGVFLVVARLRKVK